MTVSEPLYVLAARVLLVVGVSLLLVLAGQLRVFHHGGPYLSGAGVIMIFIFISAFAVIYHRRRTMRDRFLTGDL